ncbi:MAG TPA: hypothetical protein VHK47_11990 [Polyangia bacterium]|jgi:hypothetical protein|nr:hypothetical protein [Polyangia bacterium]
MSGNIRNALILGTVVLGSFVAVRSLSASTEPVMDDPPISLVATRRQAEIQDDSLAETIRRFATLARLQKHDVTR